MVVIFGAGLFLLVLIFGLMKWGYMDPYFWWKYGLNIFGIVMLVLILGIHLYTRHKLKKERARFKHLWKKQIS